jgi:hypothetical protein
MSVNTKPIGVAFEDQNIIGSDKIYSSSELGYTADAQGTVTQLTSKATAVTLNKSAGRITLNNAALAGNTAVSFTLNNTFISNNDILILNVSGGSVADATTYTTYTSSLTTGAAIITLRNLTASSQSEAVIINYALIHCV